MDPSNNEYISESVADHEKSDSASDEINDSPINHQENVVLNISDQSHEQTESHNVTFEATGQVNASTSRPPEIIEIHESFRETGEDNNARPTYPQLREILENSESDESTGEVNDSPIEEVRLTVPITDDPTLPCLTIRTWVLGITSCATLSFVNQYFGYRSNSISIPSIAAQLKIIPLGKLMATYLPKKEIRIPGTGGWSFSLNPGPFNSKEHCLVSMLAHAGAVEILSTRIITMVKTFYHHDINIFVALSLTLTTQMLGYVYAGFFRKFLVDSPYMWWPANLVQVSFFTALRENEPRRNGGLTRPQFLLVVLVASFSYHIIPSYLFPSISALSVICWVWKNSVTAHQIGAGRGGLGIASLSLNWTTIVDSLGSPLATPASVIINMLVGFVLTFYVVIPTAYWNNLFEAKRFPMISPGLFDHNGQRYNISRVVIDKNLKFNVEGYNHYSKVYLSVYSVVAYGTALASLAASLSHVGLFHGRTIWQQTKASFRDKFGDVHTRLMRKNYESVPQWWFLTLLFIVLALSFISCEGLGRQLEIRYWGLILSMSLAFIFTLPVGAIVATTNQGLPGLEIISNMIIGYTYPGKPLANTIFNIYGTGSMSHAIRFLSDFKLGEYMKIPPKSLFLVELIGIMVSLLVHFATAWWLLPPIDHICPSSVPSPWTCPANNIVYDTSIVWGVVGPLRIFGSLGLYPMLNLLLLFGFIAPLFVWLFAQRHPDKRWITLINLPVILSVAGAMPIVKPASYISWLTIGIFFNIIVFRRYRGWWARYNLILSAGLDAGVSFLTIVCYFTLRLRGIEGPDWWGRSEGDR